jgi:hypothetical protein
MLVNKFKFFLYFFIFSAIDLQAINDSLDNHLFKKRYSLDILSGASYFYLRDVGMSPLIYKGYNFSGNVNFNIEGKKFRHYTKLNFHNGGLKTLRHPQNSSKLSNLRGEADFYYTRKFHEIKQHHLGFFGGLNFNVLGNMRMHNRFGNNAYNYDFVSSLNINFQTEYDFNLFKRKFKLTYIAFTPFAAFVVRPFFASSIPSGFLEDFENEKFKSAIKSGYLTSFNNFRRFNNQFELCYYLKNQNALKIIYAWDYYQIEKTHQVKLARHSLLFGLNFKF